jgi:hypothetical protein
MKQTGTDRDRTDKHLKGKFGGQLALNCAAPVRRRKRSSTRNLH